MSRCVTIYGNELYHHGVPGMKWGVRRYQNEDGSLTEAGRKRYANEQQQALNDLAVSDRLIRLQIKNEEKSLSKNTKKKTKAVEKRNDDKVKKYEDKMKENLKEIASLKKVRKQYEKATGKIIKDLEAKNYRVSSKEKTEKQIKLEEFGLTVAQSVLSGLSAVALPMPGASMGFSIGLASSMNMYRQSLGHIGSGSLTRYRVRGNEEYD